MIEAEYVEKQSSTDGRRVDAGLDQCNGTLNNEHGVLMTALGRLSAVFCTEFCPPLVVHSSLLELIRLFIQQINNPLLLIRVVMVVCKLRWVSDGSVNGDKTPIATITAVRHCEAIAPC